MADRLFLILAVLAVAGCAGIWPAASVDPGEYKSKPPSPLPATAGIEKIAVIILNATKQEVDTEEASQIFASELQQFGGMKVFPAAVTHAAAVQRQYRLPEDAHKLGATLGVDAVLVGFITDYQPYDHPRVGVLLMLYPSAKEAEAGEARAKQTFQRVYDSDQKDVAQEVRRFAAARNSQKTPLADREYLLVMSKYMHFVADRSLRDLFAEAGVGLQAPERTRTESPKTTAEPPVGNETRKAKAPPDTPVEEKN